MLDATSRIKNLSIALEALSRVVGAKATFDSIETCLNAEIRNFWKEHYPAQTASPPRPATTTSDDDIPF